MLLDNIENQSSEVDSIIVRASELLEKAKEFTDDSSEAYQKLKKNTDRLSLAFVDLKDQILQWTSELEELQPLTGQAKNHADYLRQQAKELDRLLEDSRDSSNAAVKAANAYSNIVTSINDALEAAKFSVDASDAARNMSEGVSESTEDSKSKSTSLLDEAEHLLNEVSNLKPRLNRSKDGVDNLAQQNGKTSRGLDAISKDLQKLHLNTLSALAGHAANSSEAAENNANNARSKILGITEKLPNDKERAKEIPKRIEETRQAVRAAHAYVDKVSSIIPETLKRIESTGKKVPSVNELNVNVDDKIKQLQQKVALARNLANRIKLGMQFFENTTLQVRNPEGMQRAATYTHMSLYFKTLERFGLLAYVGNEIGTHTQMKRVRTDDYFALEIRGGVVVLKMDLGSGAQEIVHNEYVSDGKWHQVVLERTGKTCVITVRTEGKDDSVVEGYIPGVNSVFNLDQQLSKIYVGGIPRNVKVQDIDSRTYEGCIEEVEFGKIPIGLWDFIKAENNYKGCKERDELTIPIPSNGLRFDGRGYVILPRQKLNFSSETFIKMRFKTYAPEGLLFLIGKKNEDFFALELEDGEVILKFNLGSGVVTLRSGTKYNDGEWHEISATRDSSETVLTVDNVEVDSGKSPGTLQTNNQIFVGGHNGPHPYQEVSNVGFQGCIVDMQISADIIDLNKNKEALGVVSGCPVTIARIVSFANDSSGYVAMPSINLEKHSEITFKFKTAEDDALLFYAANDDQSKYLLIGLQNGMLIMKSKPGGEIISNSDAKYNDKEWHYVSATYTERRMRLDIDDIDSVETELESSSLLTTTSPLFFGGVSKNYALSDEVPVSEPLIGCLGDATVNGRFQNFADTQDRHASLASCPLGEKYEDTFDSTPGPRVTFSTDSETDEVIEETTELTSPEPTPFQQCALPLQPRLEKTKPRNGIRFGNTQYSRQEISKPDSFIPIIEHESKFSLEFKTTMPSGVMFYVHGDKHIDFIGLFIQDGKVVYMFNCGAGNAVMSSEQTYDDGEWHKVVFSRIGNKGTLDIDEDETITGMSPSEKSSVNIRLPIFIGGLSEDVARLAKNNLKGVYLSFPGCMRNVKLDDENLATKKSTAAFNTTGCSDRVEDGAFFSSTGGHIILYDKFKIGKEIQISFDIKPRSLSGILFAVHHGRADYLILQMVDGRISFSVDNGDGPISSVFTPEDDDDHFLCNGDWHTVTAAKVRNTIILSVDNFAAPPGIGKSSKSNTDTNDPMYIGGVPEPSTTRGAETLEQYTGCIRKFTINNKPQDLNKPRIIGDVQINTCPTT